MCKLKKERIGHKVSTMKNKTNKKPPIKRGKTPEALAEKERRARAKANTNRSEMRTGSLFMWNVF